MADIFAGRRWASYQINIRQGPPSAASPGYIHIGQLSPYTVTCDVDPATLDELLRIAELYYLAEVRRCCGEQFGWVPMA